ncbi:MAG: DUF4255 domain-containing protein [Gallionellaceae bacterium]
MIFAAVSHVANQLNQFLKRSFDLSEDVVVLSNIMEQDGTLAPNINNKLVVFLVNVEKDAASSRQTNFGGFDRSSSTYPPVLLNLYVMVAANFSNNNYSEALKFLSNTISFFQRQPVFDHQVTPDLDRRIDKLALDIENLNFQDLSSLWGMLSGKYQPSILYKVRMVCFDSGDVLSQLTPIKGYQAEVD